ncbi:MAG: hypothetical protein ACRENP_26055 [Longimicrobiales bacterium]
MSNSSKRVRMDQLVVDTSMHLDWQNGTIQPPVVGDRVYCVGGLAEVTKLVGKTSGGSRILELKLIDRTAAPFFAAASNVLVAPRDAA